MTPVRETKVKKVLFFTNSEYGQANVILATAYELLLQEICEVHIASFRPLEKRMKSFNGMIPNSGAQAIFHLVPGPSQLEALENTGFIGPFKPGVKGALDTYRITLPAMATCVNDNDYMAGYEGCLEIIRTIEPDLIISDPLMSQGLDACKGLSKRYVVLSPNTFLEILRKQQPALRQICRYPAISSGFPYPVPWNLVFTNVYLKIMALWILLRHPEIKALMEFRKSHKLTALPPAFNIWEKENQYLLPSIPETDFPCYIPSNVTPCGPILLPGGFVLEQDPELLSWLGCSPTVLINLGSHIRMDHEQALEFSKGLKILLDNNPKLQVLWKMKTSGGVAVTAEISKNESHGTAVTKESVEPLSLEIESGRVKILEWLSVDPLAILQSGHVVCFVHHGGSNSFHESLSAGVPQVVLPCWLDTIDFANRVEYLGIGVYGSRTAAPGVECHELSQSLMRVVGDSLEAKSMKKKADELAKLAGNVGGRKKACDKIIELLDQGFN